MIGLKSLPHLRAGGGGGGVVVGKGGGVVVGRGGWLDMNVVDYIVI